MKNVEILKPDEMVQQLAAMPEAERALVLAFAQGMMTRAKIDNDQKPA